MNMKMLAVAVVAVMVAPVAVYGIYVYVAPNFGWEFEDCYLDTADAESITLGEQPQPGMIGTNFEQTYGGTTLYKTVDGKTRPIEMYQLGENGEHITREIDRGVRYIQELDEERMLVVFYGKESNTDSFQCLKNGYRYDPNSQLTFIVTLETGKMHNITFFTREIIMINELTFEVFDAQYPFNFIRADENGYIFMCEKRYNENIYAKENHFLTITFDEEDNLSYEWGERCWITNTFDRVVRIWELLNMERYDGYYLDFNDGDELMVRDSDPDSTGFNLFANGDGGEYEVYAYTKDSEGLKIGKVLDRNALRYSKLDDDLGLLILDHLSRGADITMLYEAGYRHYVADEMYALINLHSGRLYDISMLNSTLWPRPEDGYIEGMVHTVIFERVVPEGYLFESNDPDGNKEVLICFDSEGEMHYERLRSY